MCLYVFSRGLSETSSSKLLRGTCAPDRQIYHQIYRHIYRQIYRHIYRQIYRLACERFGVGCR